MGITWNIKERYRYSSVDAVRFDAQLGDGKENREWDFFNILMFANTSSYIEYRDIDLC